MKTIWMILLCLTVVACAPYKPPLDETQVVDGNSIVIPPEFNQLPKEN